MPPYRQPPTRANPPLLSHPEELILYGLLVVIGAIPVAITLVQQAIFGVEATLGLLMVCAGAIGAITYARRARIARAPRDGHPAGGSDTGTGSRIR